MKKTFMAGLMVATALTCAAPADAQNIFEALSETYNTNPTLHIWIVHFLGQKN